MPVSPDTEQCKPAIILDNSLAFLTPGQGGQAIRLGSSLAERSRKAALVGQMADDIFGGEFVDTYNNGPKEKVDLTQWTIRIVAKDTIMRMVGLEDLRPAGTEGWFTEDGISREKYRDGLSAGIITTGVGVWYDAEEAFKFIDKRARIMGDFFEQIDARMFAMMDVDEQIRTDMVGKFDVKLCLDNTDQQQVYGGETKVVTAAVKWLRDERDLAKEQLAELPIGGVFHHPLLAPVVAELAPAIDNMQFFDKAAHGKVLMSNTTGRPLQSAADVRVEFKGHNLVPVQHRESMHYLVKVLGVTTMVAMDSSRRLVSMNADMFWGDSRKAIKMNETPKDNGKPPILVQTWHAD